MPAFYRFRHNSRAYLSGSLSNGHAYHAGFSQPWSRLWAIMPQPLTVYQACVSLKPTFIYIRVHLQLHRHHIPLRGKKSSSWPSVDTSKATHILRRRSLLHFPLSTLELPFSASTHLRNLYISKKIHSQCRYQSAASVSVYRSVVWLSARHAPAESTQQPSHLSGRLPRRVLKSSITDGDIGSPDAERGKDGPSATVMDGPPTS
ncbi:hypothetical protein Tco_0646951 [Tanacetum coccineum]